MTEVDLPAGELAQDEKPKNVERRSVLDVLRFRDFRLLWIGESISLLGDQFYYVALPWLTLKLSDGSGLALGVMLMLSGIPRAVLMLLGGAISDRYSPRTIMIVSNAVRGLLVGLLTALVLLDSVQLWHLYVTAFFFGVVDAFFYPAYNSMMPLLVDPDYYEPGNAVMLITSRLGILIGPGIAGAVVAAVGTGAAMGVDTLTFIVAVIALVLMRSGMRKIPPRPTAEDVESGAAEPAPGLLASIREGFRYVLSDPLLVGAMLMIGIADFSVVGPINVGLPVLADQRFIEGASGFGLMLSAFGGGSLLGALLAGAIKFPRRGLLFIGLMGLFSVVMLVMAFAPTLVVACGAMGLAGIGNGLFSVIGVSLLQKRTDPAMMGRVMSLITLSSVGLQPISNAIAGLLVEVSIPVLFIAPAILIGLGGAALILNRSIRELR